MLPGERGVTLVNNRSPDTTLPTTASGVLLDRRVSLGDVPYHRLARMRLSVADEPSGVSELAG